MTVEEILKHPIKPGQDIDLTAFIPYATYVNHPEPVEMLFEERLADEQELFGKWRRVLPPVEWGRATGYFAVPKELV